MFVVTVCTFNLRRQFDALKGRKSTRPEGVKSRNEFFTSQVCALRDKHNDYCIFLLLIFHLKTSKKKLDGLFCDMDLELITAPMPVGNCWPKSNMLVFCRHVAHKPKQSLSSAVRAATQAANLR